MGALTVSFAKTIITTLIIAASFNFVSALFCGDDNCFELLGVKRDATKSEIRRAYRRLSQEKHPDKRPGDEKALEEFRKIGAAYEALTDDAKRAKYEDFLDNPTKYWQYLMENTKDNYAPRSNVYLVLTGIIGVVTLIHWLNMNHTYKSTLLRLKESQDFKREVSRLVKSKQASSKEEAEAMINLDVVGLEEPNWRNLIIFKILALPPQLVKSLLWNIKWVFNYKIRKQDYTEEDKLYLIKKNLKIPSDEWSTVPEKEKDLYMKEELWDKTKCEEFVFRRRIAMNKLGKGKKKKKQPSIPYSEVEEVSM